MCLILAAAQPGRSAGTGNAVRFAGMNGELRVEEVSERTVRIRFIPPSAPENTNAPGSVLVPFESRERLRATTIERPREISIAGLRVSVSSQPLTVSVKRADGKDVQQLVFDEAGGTNAAVSF
ncbi:MAG TPA: hypothetical protein PKH32_14000, partial [Verrucomicrobiota bacterium]|nr:hypothetical protein [Verrucomicrobiota bacterium]